MTMTPDTRETDQLEECDQYKVDEDFAEYNAYRRMVEHARSLERERDEARERADTMFAKHVDILDQTRNERDELICAGRALKRAKGRFHTEQAATKLFNLLP